MVTVDGREISYDALIVALGAELAPDAVPGLADAHSSTTWQALSGYATPSPRSRAGA